MFLFLFLYLLPSFEAALVINVSPTKVDAGLSRNLNVECLSSPGEVPAMSYLTSLSLYFAKNNPETEQSDHLESQRFSYLASINSFDSIVNVETDQTSSVKYFGQINRSNASFLRLIWEYPDSRQAGVYKCEANGINVIGKPVSLTAESSVTAVDPDAKRLIAELQKLSRMVEGIQLRVNSSETRIEFLESESQLKFFRQQAVEEALFVEIPEFQGRKYMLTKNRLLMTADQAVMLCGMFDGYLAEIDTEAEYNYLRDHVFKPSSFDFVVTGATDEKNEGVWINRCSQSRATFFNWGIQQPQGGRLENCQCFARYDSWLQHDLTCSVVTVNSVGFLCEADTDRKQLCSSAKL
ncbi:collectin-11 [Biomphalaria pfeifferi]|uniref:Collectin-11 n=1 Tax=Biomphalaria pfeifferi TaxID=112525 RepID=A0AAD8BNE2_BIOPF|nr:collectin-11 [Biomphalaria pfeifferi]